MELKRYQQDVITDLDRFLEKIQQSKVIEDAFQDYWKTHPVTPVKPLPGKAVEPYKDNITGVPHICVKVPTAGGKTFIACNALKTIFDSFDHNRPRAVVWLVPSITILDQTIKNLRDTSHPYRQKINAHFRNKVEVFDKAALLMGSGFNATSIKEQLSIMVFSFDSLRARKMEDRKVFQENGNLQSFETLIAKGDELTLGSVIKYLNPIVVVDESHNAESELSIEMLKELNPCFILDLTATPRSNSNIISFVDAIELKKDNMVKLPVIVYNQPDKTEVINAALQLQRRLELQAKEDEENGGKYIRPIVLFQAQPRNAKDNTTFEKLKEKLIELKIPAERIKIKTADINELKEFDDTSKYPNGLMDKACPVRYIITVNALREGWDCPFAYILASLADKSSAVDVTQILGRVLRLPYVSKNNAPFLNFSYVITASSKFIDTLQHIVEGLNNAGFSDKDYKLADENQLEDAGSQDKVSQLDWTDDIDARRIPDFTRIDHSKSVDAILTQAEAQNAEFEEKIAMAEKNNDAPLPNELTGMVKQYDMKEVFKEEASQIVIPQFYLKTPVLNLFSSGTGDVLLEKESLLEEFELGKADTHISFDGVSADLFKVDLDETKKDHTPTFVKLDGKIAGRIKEYILDPSQKENRIKNLAALILDMIGNIYAIDDKELKKYIIRILEGFKDEQFKDFVDHEYSYIQKIKEKIDALSVVAAEKTFRDSLDTDQLFVKPSYTLKLQISPGETAKDITKSLY
ncbi:DEAD/DEAH box helicase [Dinghuibacter silviterrae]|uniref:DEAD/DEAH box helicase n=1 Tax=Dinghuibacter silviterrae TaxID=1539049 RepID=UPI001B885DB9|nr:DEAD/DEAH box helicase family protein [Dinghuibacter silviterrae]